MYHIFHRKKGYMAVSVISILLCGIIIGLAYSQEGPLVPDLPICLGLSLAIAILLLLMFPTKRKETGYKVVQIILNVLTLVLSPAAAVFLVQNFTLDPMRIYPTMMWVNILFYVLIYLILSCILGSIRAGYVAADLLFLILGIGNYFVVQFRGSPIVPWDLFSIGTAASVAGNYTYEIYWRFAVSAIGFLVLVALDLKNSIKIHPIARVILGLLFTAGLVVSTMQLQKKEVKTKLGMDMTLFTPNVRYRNNGFLAAFLGNLHLINVQEPSGYSVRAVEKIQEEIHNTHQDEETANSRAAAQTLLEEGKMPHIIIVMDEAFSDLQALGSFRTDVDYMPNFRGLMEEGTGGQIMVSVKGGNTANSEYELFSGDTMAFLPSGSVVYQQFIRDNIPVLPSYLASLGYETTAIHPYLSTGWDRNKVYPLLGFHEFLSQEDFATPEMLRLYISDRSAFKKIVQVYEQQKEDGPQFIFEVTMQNHSGYSKEYPGFSEEVHIPDIKVPTVQTRAAEKYLTLIKHSDEALGEMMEYFRQVDEPVILLMFGDHQPSDYVTDVIKRLVGYDPEKSLEEAQKAYMVPYFIWNNCGLTFDVPQLTSLNYMAANILKTAGLPLTQYHEFLLDLQEKLPAISAGAYVDTDGVYYSFDEKNEVFDEALNRYNILQYNHMTDISNRVTSLFGQPAADAAS